MSDRQSRFKKIKKEIVPTKDATSELIYELNQIIQQT